MTTPGCGLMALNCGWWPGLLPAEYCGELAGLPAGRMTRCMGAPPGKPGLGPAAAETGICIRGLGPSLPGMGPVGMTKRALAWSMGILGLMPCGGMPCGGGPCGDVPCGDRCDGDVAGIDPGVIGRFCCCMLPGLNGVPISS